jgi:hypothetical protein
MQTAKNGGLGGKPGAEVLGASVEENKLSKHKPNSRHI